MRYTKYFSFIVKENGQPQMTANSFRTLMNIVHLEGVLNGLNKSKEAHKGTDTYYKYDVAIFKEQSRLTDVTGNIENYIENDLKYDIELDSAFGVLTFWSTPLITTTAYNTLQNKGLDLIQNEEFHNILSMIIRQRKRGQVFFGEVMLEMQRLIDDIEIEIKSR